MRLTRKNYHSEKANIEFMSASQFKSFMDCPARAMAELKGEYKYESDSLLQGLFLDAYFEHKTERFKVQHPEMFKRDGTLKAQFEKVNDAIAVIDSDPIMQKLCSGKQQKIMTGEIGGVPFKIMIDSLLKDRIVDRKYMRDFADVWKDGECMPWWKAWQYDFQAAIYVEIYRQNTGNLLPFELVGVSKETVPDKAWVRFSEAYLAHILEIVEINAPLFMAMKQGIADLQECGHCDFCKSKKMLFEPEII